MGTPGHSPLLTPPGVYAPQDDTELLLRALVRERVDPSTHVLDLGTGSGALALRAAGLGARVTAVDIAWRAVLTTRLNALIARRRVTVRRGDLTAAVRGRTYDLVVSNPPYVPSPRARLPRHSPARAWDAGPDGRAFVDRVCDEAPTALRTGGVLLLVHSALCGTAATLRRLADAGFDASVTDRAVIPFGPVLATRRGWLRHQGLLTADDDNREELVVIRAQHS
ncbi:HemK2/MTQ2 family protein methyltransferase [Streptomyces sp. NPDC005227]|uniref:HemK2/MTQ2 family protein methyltransferase n=1 Tax=unclassified Streptomyces TaxID=2593676 RepID=UPI0036833470